MLERAVREADYTPRRHLPDESSDVVTRCRASATSPPVAEWIVGVNAGGRFGRSSQVQMSQHLERPIGRRYLRHLQLRRHGSSRHTIHALSM